MNILLVYHEVLDQWEDCTRRKNDDKRQITTFAKLFAKVVIYVNERDSNADKRDRFSAMSLLSCKIVGVDFHCRKIQIEINAIVTRGFSIVFIIFFLIRLII